MIFLQARKLCYRPKKGQLRAVWRAHEVVVGAERYALPRATYSLISTHNAFLGAWGSGIVRLISAADGSSGSCVMQATLESAGEREFIKQKHLFNTWSCSTPV